MITETAHFDLRPYMKKELAQIYNMSPKAFNSFIKTFEKEIGTKKGRYYTVKQVETLIKCVGLPRKLTITKEKTDNEFYL